MVLVAHKQNPNTNKVKILSLGFKKPFSWRKQLLLKEVNAVVLYIVMFVRARFFAYFFINGKSKA